VSARHIRRATPLDRGVLFDVWLRSVQATHTFVSETDLQSFLPLVRDYLASTNTDFWVLCDADAVVIGFMGLAGHQLESLFLVPEFHRRGGGRCLVQHAYALKGELTVDVNEQNTAAVSFYKACGFVVEHRSELDETGRPYPLLHMRREAPAITLRPVEGDRSAFVPLLLEADEAESILRTYLHHGDLLELLAPGAQRVGVVLLISPEPAVIEIKNIVISRAYRGQGLGRTAMRRIATHARARGAVSLLVGTADASTRTIAFYRACGFSDAGRIKGFFDRYPAPVIEDGLHAHDMLRFEMRL
jgi:putative acetyltransferase